MDDLVPSMSMEVPMVSTSPFLSIISEMQTVYIEYEHALVFNYINVDLWKYGNCLNYN